MSSWVNRDGSPRASASHPQAAIIELSRDVAEGLTADLGILGAAGQFNIQQRTYFVSGQRGSMAIATVRRGGCHSTRMNIRLVTLRAAKLGKNFGERVRLHLHHAGKGFIDYNDN